MGLHDPASLNCEYKLSEDKCVEMLQVVAHQHLETSVMSLDDDEALLPRLACCPMHLIEVFEP